MSMRHGGAILDQKLRSGKPLSGMRAAMTEEVTGSPGQKKWGLRLLPLVVIFLFCSLPAFGTTITAASCSQTDVQNAVNSAVSGDTVIVRGACSVSWGSAVTISPSQGITIQASGSVTLNGFGFLDSYVGPGSFVRITGFTFTSPGDGNGTPQAIILGNDAASATPRIDHNTFTNTAQSIFIGIYGLGSALIDHNTFTGGGASEEIHVYGTGSNTDASGWTDSVTPGGPTMVFIEDNTFGNFSTNTICSGLESYYGARTVIRHNTFNYCQIDQHGTAGAIGARWWEAYDNVFNTPNGQNNCCLITMRAGSGVIWGNTANGANTGGGTIEVYEEDSGYPALYQVGRGINQELSPAYIWGNGSIPVFSGTSNVVEGRDYVITTNQPASLERCERSTDAGTSSSCSTMYSYVPYTYPHPLQGGSAPVQSSLAPPTGLKASAQ
jgi:hypothetical protein